MTGYIRDTHDSKDWIFGAMAPPRELPKRLNYESLMGPALDQGPTFECVAYSVAGLKRFHEWKQSRRWLDFDPALLYAECKQADGFPNIKGTAPRTALEILRSQGMSASDGSRYRIESYARQTSVDSIKQALFEQGPVVLGVHIDIAAFNSLSDATLDQEQMKHVTGHCMLAVGFDDDLNALRVRNSWGENWGDNGHLWLSYNYLTDVDPKFDAWSTYDTTL